MKKVSAVYKITNTITGDFYIGSSKNVKERWIYHKCPSTWNRYSNNPMYLDMKKYGVDKFEFEILEEVEIEHLKEKEQYFIELLKPAYNNYNAKGLNVERCKKSLKEYQKEYQKSNKYKKYKKEYDNQLCRYNGETLTLCALRMRFRKKGISNPTQEAKKYIKNNNPIEFYDVYP